MGFYKRQAPSLKTDAGNMVIAMTRVWCRALFAAINHAPRLWRSYSGYSRSRLRSSTLVFFDFLKLCVDDITLIRVISRFGT